MIDETLAQFRAHRQNINRYRSLLQTGLTEFERHFIEQRIAEEEAAMSVLAFGASPPDMLLLGQDNIFRAARRCV